MTDLSTPARRQSTPPSRRPGALSTLTWALLVLSVVANTVASAAGAPLAVHLGLGVLTAVCVAAVTAVQLRARR